MSESVVVDVALEGSDYLCYGGEALECGCVDDAIAVPLSLIPGIYGCAAVSVQAAISEVIVLNREP
jgi:hypothetical protein